MLARLDSAVLCSPDGVGFVKPQQLRVCRQLDPVAHETHHRTLVYMYCIYGFTWLQENKLCIMSFTGNHW
jgi:hypothetical protein